MVITIPACYNKSGSIDLLHQTIVRFSLLEPFEHLSDNIKHKTQFGTASLRPIKCNRNE